MPTYFHQCQDASCNYEWEDFYSITTDPPTTCPKCNQETARRLINCATKGVVELSGSELTAKVKEDANQMQRDMATSEKMYSNMLGEGHYQQMQQRIDYSKRNRGDY
jgi:putative FmdB family regulatory protein